jgi:predicted transposase YdaD
MADYLNVVNSFFFHVVAFIVSKVDYNTKETPVYKPGLQGRKEGRKKGKKEGRKEEGRKERRKEGKKDSEI